MSRNKKIAKNSQVTFDNMHLLGCYDRYTGRAYLTTWDGDSPIIDVVITGCHEISVPMWGGPAPEGAEMIAVPEGKNHKEFAKEINGIHAFGWHAPTSIEYEINKVINEK